MIEIKRSLKWEGGKVPYPYAVELENGKTYVFAQVTGKWTEESHTSTHSAWKLCSPLEVIVVCGTKGLEEEEE